MKDINTITLKKVFIDEIGQTVTNDFDQPLYAYYSEDKDFIIKIEVPGEGAELKTKVEKSSGFYIFTFIGKKPNEQDVIDKPHKVKSPFKNCLEFKFDIHVSIKDITLGLNEKGRLNFYERSSNNNGIFTFKYHLNERESTDFE